MRGLHFKSALFGFGLGVVGASLVFLIFQQGGKSAQSSDSGARVGAAATNRIVNSQNIDDENLPYASGRVILLDDGGARELEPDEAATMAAAQFTATQPTSIQPTTGAQASSATTGAPQTVTRPTTAQPTTAQPTATQSTAQPTSTQPTTTQPTTTQSTTQPTTQPPAAAQPTNTQPTSTQPAPQPTATQPTAAQESAAAITVTIVRGDTATAVAKKLYDSGVVASTADFLWRLGERRLTGELLDGTYNLNPNLDLDVLIDKITVHK